MVLLLDSTIPMIVASRNTLGVAEIILTDRDVEGVFVVGNYCSMMNKLCINGRFFSRIIIVRL